MSLEPERSAGPRPAPDAVCANCGARLRGPFCSECGQESRDIGRVSVLPVVREWLAELFGLESRLLRTLGALVAKPGFLTSEYLAGRRVSYVRPLRLFVILSIAMFLSIGLAGGRLDFTLTSAEETVVTAGGPLDVERPGDPPDLADVEHGAAALIELEGDAGRRVLDRLPQVMLVLAPVFALFVWLLHRRRSPLYVPHLIFALHVHSFWFLVWSLAVMIDAVLPDGIEVGGFLLLAANPAYLFLAQRRVYSCGWLFALTSTVFLLLAQIVAVVLVVAGLVLAAVALS